MAGDRSAQCPNRGAGLSHITDPRRAPFGQCVYCRQPVEFVAEPYQPQGPEAPLDVTERLRSLGMLPARDYAGEADHAEETPCEPQACFSRPSLPDDPPYFLTERTRKRLEFVKHLTKDKEP